MQRKPTANRFSTIHVSTARRLHQQVTAGSEAVDGLICPADGLGIQPRGERARCAWGVRTARHERVCYRGPRVCPIAPEGRAPAYLHASHARQ